MNETNVMKQLESIAESLKHLKPIADSLHEIAFNRDFFRHQDDMDPVIESALEKLGDIGTNIEEVKNEIEDSRASLESIADVINEANEKKEQY